MRMLANVPRTITSWLPRREPYELKSRGDTPCSINHLPAGVSLPIAPAGEMWSVVTESPNLPSTRRPFNGSIVPASLDKFWKNDGFWIYVELSSKSYNGASVTSILFQVSLESNTVSYSFLNNSGVTVDITVSLTSLIEGQISFMYTSLPSLSFPNGSLRRSISTVPASAYATTS